jgi:lysyl-tRNA synthetase class 2
MDLCTTLRKADFLLDVEVPSSSEPKAAPSPSAPVRWLPIRWAPTRIRRNSVVRQERSARWAARLVTALGVVSVVSALFGPLRFRLHLLTEVLPPLAPEVAAAMTLPLGLILIQLSVGLRRRKRRAWQVAVGVSAMLVVLHVVKGLDVEEALFSAVVLGLLLNARPAFTGAPDPRSRRHVAVVLIGGSLAATVVGSGLILVDPGDVVGSFNGWILIRHVLLGLIGITGPLEFSSSAGQGRIASSLLLLGCMITATTLVAALRPAGGPHRLRPEEAARIRDLLKRHGSQDSLGYFALRDDKSVIFSPSGKAAITYRVIAGVSLASGDPLGDNEAWPGAIGAWLDEAARYAWIPAVLGCSERAAAAYARSGLDALELGDEAVVSVKDFSLDGRSMRGVRQTTTRLARKGYSAEVSRFADLSPDRLLELAALAEHWRDGAERGFSMALGRFCDPRDHDITVVICRDADGVPQGLLGFVPWGADGLSLDVMRRSRTADNGVVELMVTALLEKAAERGIERVSLNFAVFRAVFERGSRLGAGPVLRLWHRVLLVASKFWQIESLYRANAKYRPAWEPRFLCFIRARDLLRIATAALAAEAFIKLPRMRSRSREGC